jgi:uncharacterized protein YgiM (DUF1202 family)
MTSIRTQFNPTTHGFLFKNQFSLDFPIKFDLPLGGSIDANVVLDGLSGGMCFTALDYYHTVINRPGQTDPTQVDAKLRVYLCERHLDAINIHNILNMLGWMLQEKAAVAARISRYEVPKLRRALDKGRPVPLILVRANRTDNTTPNHCVVASGYDWDEDTQECLIQIYDPNHPGLQTSIRVTLRGSESGFSLTHSIDSALAALFSIPYRTQGMLPRLLRPFPPLPFAPEVEGIVPFKLHWPVDSRRVNQFFKENPETYKPFGLPGHEGLDLFAVSGANIYAAADGDVYQANFPGNHPYGRQIRIKHTLGGKVVHTIYGHLSKIMVSQGQHVAAGTLIGEADNTGNSFGSHLHLTLKIEGEKTHGYPAGIVDPWPYLKEGTPENPEHVGPLPALSEVKVFTIQDLNLRSSPSTNSQILAALPAGESLQVFGETEDVRKKIGVDGEWLHVQTAGNQIGHVAAWFVQDSEQVFPPSDLVLYPFDLVNLRSGAGTAFQLLAELTMDEPLTVLGDAGLALAKLGRQNEWLQVQTQQGLRGFVAAWLVHKTGQRAPASGLVVYPFEMVNVRARPAVDANILTVATSSAALTVLGERNQTEMRIGQMDAWLNVNTPDNFTGYVAAWLVSTAAPAPPSPSPTPLEPSPLKVTATADVNMRAQPGSNSPRVSGLFNNETMLILEPDLAVAATKIGKPDQWIYGENPNGERGWVAAQFLRKAS